MTYRIVIKPKAIKALEKINQPYYSKIKEAIYALSNDPRPGRVYKIEGA